MIIFSLFMFVLMLMIAGISLDVERFEVVRTKVQNTADGAALAAASLTQDMPAVDIVHDYFAAAGMSQFFDDVHVVESPGSKHVTVETSVNVPTHFLNMMGIKNLGAPVRSAAAESINDIEISLVLDVSGSMGSNSKLTNLKVAAKDFIDTIYADKAPDTVSTSIVPYSTQVAIGEDVLKHMQAALTEEHTNSHCIDFDAADFNTTDLDLAGNYEQTAHFDARSDWWSAENGLGIEECSTREWFEVMVKSQNTTNLKNYIDAFQATDWTSIELGTKWGAALLDPSFQPIVAAMAAEGAVDAAFADRPAAHSDADTMKVMVIMTDGINTNQHQMKGAFRHQMSDVFVWNDALGRPYYSVYGGNGNPMQAGEPRTVVDGWYLTNVYTGDGMTEGDWMDMPHGGIEATRLSWEQVWEVIPVDYFTDTILVGMGDTSNLATQIQNSVVAKNNGDKDPNTLAICSAAKNAGITVYTISFEAPTAAATLLSTCASTPSHAFKVEGTEISAAFSAIAADINRLRLMN